MVGEQVGQVGVFGCLGLELGALFFSFYCLLWGLNKGFLLNDLDLLVASFRG